MGNNFKYLRLRGFITSFFVLTALPLSVHGSSFFSPYSNFELGQKAVEKYAKQTRVGKSPLTNIIKNLEASTVMIETMIQIGSPQNPQFVTDRSSGIVIQEGNQILTTGHSNQGEIYSIKVVGKDQKIRYASLISHVWKEGREDWALLDVAKNPFPSSYAVETGQIQEQDHLIVLGYPEHLGKLETGKVVQSSGTLESWVSPLCSITQARNIDGQTFIMEGISGNVITGGGSGGPIFNFKGELVGIYVSYSTEVPSNMKHSVPQYTMRGMSISQDIDETIAMLK